jgi:hypothetical protein
MIALIDRTQQAGTAISLYDFCLEDMQFELLLYFRVSVASLNLVLLTTQTGTRSAPFMLLLLRISINLPVLFDEVTSKNVDQKINQDTLNITFLHHLHNRSRLMTTNRAV